MTSRTRVPRWTPPLKEALRLAWRPALAYFLFTALGSLALVLTSAWYARGTGRDVLIFMLGTAAGLVGVLLGQLIAILRLRALPVFIASGCFITGAAWMMSLARPPGGEYLAVPMVFFCFAFPCGLLSLMHRWELFASFWPAVGWIGGVFLILNEEGRVNAWEENKVSAWLPVPLLFLGCFLVLWLFYLAAKQAARVEMWQALSGAAARRIAKAEAKKTRAAAIPRRNVLPLLVVAALLFGGTALLAPYLWRTGKGDREGHRESSERDRSERRTPSFDGEGIARQLQKMAAAAKETLPKLWPLLFLLVLYRPAKRALLLSHLKTPVVLTPPSERIDNLWEYVRIAAEDAGVVPTSADSVEQLMTRIRAVDRSTPDLEKAAEIYVRTRYGFTVQRGDAIAMRGHATGAARSLRERLGAWATVKNLWRPLE
ncbi:MAG: hypothetical protein KF764_13195 [Labilithrix sp.]|nr:hypothetical protein [Labilithrix sp.]